MIEASARSSFARRGVCVCLVFSFSGWFYSSVQEWSVWVEVRVGEGKEGREVQVWSGGVGSWKGAFY